METIKSHFDRYQNFQDPNEENITRDERASRLKAMYDYDQKEMIGELKALGINIQSVWDLVNSPNNYTCAIPILLKHLSEPHYPRVLEGIVRSLAIRDLRGNELLWKTAVDLYKKTPPDKLIPEPYNRGLSATLGLLLSVIMTKKEFPEVQKLMTDYPDLDGRTFMQKGIKRVSTKV